MISFFIKLSEHIGDIVGVVSIIITIILSVSSQKGNKNKLRAIIASILFACSTVVSLSIYIREKWCIVPNLYGLTYDTALQRLNDVDLTGNEILFLPNENLPVSKYRVVWQSAVPGSIAFCGDTVFLVSDNFFQHEYNPIERPLGHIDPCEWKWQRDNKRVQIQLPFAYSNDMLINYNAFTFDIYSEELASALQAIIDDYIDDVLFTRGDIYNCRMIAKLVSRISDEHMSRIKCIKMEGHHFWQNFDGTHYESELLLPMILYSEDYILLFSLYDNCGNHYDSKLSVSFVPSKMFGAS